MDTYLSPLSDFGGSLAAWDKQRRSLLTRHKNPVIYFAPKMTKDKSCFDEVNLNKYTIPSNKYQLYQYH